MGWDVQGYLAARGIAIIAAGDRSADQTDELAEKLEQMGIL